MIKGSIMVTGGSWTRVQPHLCPGSSSAECGEVTELQRRVMGRLGETAVPGTVGERLDPCGSRFISLFPLDLSQIKIQLEKCFPFSLGRIQMSTSPGGTGLMTERPALRPEGQRVGSHSAVGSGF